MTLSTFLLLTADAGSPEPPIDQQLTRDQVLSVRLDFQGFDVPGITTLIRDDETGRESSRVWEPQLVLFSPEDRARIWAWKREQGHTHVNLTLTKAAATDLAADVTRVLDLFDEARRAGGAQVLLLACMGDGNGDPHGENYDPGALGYPWLMAHFSEIVAIVKGRGLHERTIYMPGYDGVIPGWQPWTRVEDFARMARAVVGSEGYLAPEMSGGYWAYSGERDDWGTPAGQLWDLLLFEFNPRFGPTDDPIPPDFIHQSDDVRAPFDQYWQISRRVLGPKFNRPPEMPEGDDSPDDYQGGPLTHQTPRGPFYVNAFEWDTYRRMRRGDKTDVDRHRAYLRGLGWPLVS